MSHSRYSPTATPMAWWDASAQDYYFYDNATDQLIYHRTGHRTQRPAHIPRASLALQLTELPPNQYNQDPSGIHEALYHYDSGASDFIAESATTLNSSAQTAHVPPSQTWIRTEQGRPVVHAFNPFSRVETRLITNPFHQTPDLTLPPATRVLLGSGGDHEELFPSFIVRDHHFFVVGRVFVILWAEPAGEASVRTVLTDTTRVNRPDRGLSQGRFGEFIYSKVRRFVVVRAGRQFCTALPITSYGHQGVGKPGVVKSEHAIVYTGNAPPNPLPTELPSRGERPMQQRPIRVVADNVMRDRLDAMSRLHFGQPHTVQHNIKVKPFGMVHPSSLQDLSTQFMNAFMPTPPQPQ